MKNHETRYTEAIERNLANHEKWVKSGKPFRHEGKSLVELRMAMGIKPESEYYDNRIKKLMKADGANG
jgi:hypothetical protein